MSTDSWRKVVVLMESLRRYEPNFGTIADVERPCIFFNGALHTVAITCCHSFILSFDISDESFCEIVLPPNHLDRLPVNLLNLQCSRDHWLFSFSFMVVVVSYATYGLWRSMVWPNLGLENIWYQ